MLLTSVMHPKQPKSLHSTGLDLGLGSEGVGFGGLVLCKFPGPCSRQRVMGLSNYGFKQGT